MDLKSDNLRLPYIAPAQAQKHVTHNEALRMLDALVQISLKSINTTTPPQNPDNGDRYYIIANASGQWAENAGKIAAWQDGAWAYLPPQTGWQAWVEDEAAFKVWDGVQWQNISADTQNLDMIGINTTADTINKLAIKSDAVLFDNNGAGVQFKVNKQTFSDTASILYQTNYSGRAEIGLAGDDNFHFKVSPDGSSWKEAIIVDRNTGRISLPNTATSIITHSARYTLNTDKRWVSAAQPSYGMNYFAGTENQGTGIDPVKEWENMGFYIPKGSKIHAINLVGRTSSTEITDIELYFYAKYPNPISRWETGMSSEAHRLIADIHRDNFFIPSNGNGFTGSITQFRRRRIEPNFIMPEDGMIVLDLKPQGDITSTRYFYTIMTIELSLPS